MTENDINDPNIIAIRHGDPVFRGNPSVPNSRQITKTKKVQFGDEQRGFIIDQSDGTLSVGGATFYEFEEVDNTRFVKLFLEGLKQASGLKSAGLKVFEVVYLQLQEKPSTDEVRLSYLIAKEYITDLNDRTFRRGVRELLDNEFIFRSPTEGVFFVNIRFMFNGDRLAFVKGFQRRGTGRQQELALSYKEESEALTSEEEEIIDGLAEQYQNVDQY